MINDYVSGLQALLYLKSIPEMKDWDGQSPPTPQHQKGKEIANIEDVVNQVRQISERAMALSNNLTIFSNLTICNYS